MNKRLDSPQQRGHKAKNDAVQSNSTGTRLNTRVDGIGGLDCLSGVIDDSPFQTHSSTILSHCTAVE
jgi:hypothetical protein